MAPGIGQPVRSLTSMRWSKRIPEIVAAALSQVHLQAEWSTEILNREVSVRATSADFLPPGVDPAYLYTVLGAGWSGMASGSRGLRTTGSCSLTRRPHVERAPSPWPAVGDR